MSRTHAAWTANHHALWTERIKTGLFSSCIQFGFTFYHVLWPMALVSLLTCVWKDWWLLWVTDDDYYFLYLFLLQYSDFGDRSSASQHSKPESQDGFSLSISLCPFVNGCWLIVFLSSVGIFLLDSIAFDNFLASVRSMPLLTGMSAIIPCRWKFICASRLFIQSFLHLLKFKFLNRICKHLCVVA